MVTPYYNRPSQAGIYEHFRAVAEAAGDLPVLLYDIPIRSGRRIETATMLRLAREVPAIVALKDAAGDPPSTAHLAAQAPAGIRDLQRRRRHDAAAAGRRRGRASSAWPRTGSGRSSAAVVDAFLAGDLAGAIAGNAELLDSFDFESTAEYPNPLPAKAALRALGLPSRPVPPAHGGVDPGARRPGGQDPGRRRPTGGHGRPAWLSAANRSPSGSSSWAGWARSAGTAPASRSRAASSSSTAGSCSPTPTCRASTSSCPSSPTCTIARTGSTASSSRTATRTTPAAWPTCCVTCTHRSTAPS